MYRTKKAINFWVSSSEAFSSLGDLTSTLEMHWKEKKHFSVFSEQYPHGYDRNAGSEMTQTNHQHSSQDDSSQ